MLQNKTLAPYKALSALRFFLPVVLLCISQYPTNLLQKLMDSRIFTVHVLHRLINRQKNTTTIIRLTYRFTLHGLFDLCNPSFQVVTNDSTH